MEAATSVDWYFDVISPFAYLQAEQLTDWLPPQHIHARPVVLGALLSHWQTRGPAEIPRKRVQTYRSALARADAVGVPMRFPPAHPFDPLPLLRMTVAAGGGFIAAREVLRFVWREGREVCEPGSLQELGQRLEVERPLEAVGRAEVKTALRNSTDAAIQQGVFGVPTLVVRGELFWGEDASAMARRTWEHDAGWLRQGEWARAASLPVGVHRKI